MNGWDIASSVATMAAAAATCITVGVLVYQLREGSKQLRALQSQTTMSALLDLHDKVFFGGRGGRNAEIIRRIECKQPLVEGEVTEYDLDDYLGAFEMIELLLEKSALDWDYAYHMFSHYVWAAWVNEEIAGHIERLIETDPTTYVKFRDLAQRVIERRIAEGRESPSA